ncbi:MAG: ImmA/IrrE family metallo-endopeptidase [Candidatus Lokiarchaeota archaeon]|nr:ImmA/IrrE family metallo-endopeptidase [Candidatus Lokiarchaeota archaeon]
MDNIKPRRMRWEEIREKAEEFRRKHVKPIELVPVPIEDIIEFDLQLEIWPIKGLLQTIDIDGFLSRDLQTIFVDERIYMDSRYYRRLRFTYAHEIGHLILHPGEIKSCKFRTSSEWKKFRKDFSEDALFWFEQQAYEFAGRLLVPKKRLIEELTIQSSKIDQYRALTDTEDEELLIRAVSRIICDTFDVSDEVIFRRVKYEKVWSEIN